MTADTVLSYNGLAQMMNANGLMEFPSRECFTMIPPIQTFNKIFGKTMTLPQFEEDINSFTTSSQK